MSFKRLALILLIIFTKIQALYCGEGIFDGLDDIANLDENNTYNWEKQFSMFLKNENGKNKAKSGPD